MRKKVVTLFGGHSDHAPARFHRAAREFGRLVAEAGWTLRTGAGSGPNIMGAAADGALGAGGRVEGVILEKFWDVRHRGLHRLVSTSTFALRKARLIRGTTAIVVFPGGVGTIDELGDVLALKQNGFIDVPIVLANLYRYYDPILAWFRQGIRAKFLKPEDLSLLRIARTPGRAVALLETD